MASRVYFWRLFSAYFLVLLAGIACVGGFAAYRLHAVRFDGEKRALLDESRLVFAVLKNDLRSGDAGSLQDKLMALHHSIGARITIVADDGKVLAETSVDPANMENHRLRPEVVAAAANGSGESSRLSHTTGIEMIYLATRHDVPGEPPCFVRLSMPLDSLTKGLHRFDESLALLAALALLLGGGLCGWLAYRQARPVTQLSQFATALARDEFETRTHIAEEGAVGVLGQALNQIAESLAATKTQAGERQENLLAVLRSMSDGVIATDRQQRVLLANPAAGNLLDFNTGQSTGRPLWESLRDERALKAATEVLASGTGQTLKLAGRHARHIELSISPLLHQNRPEGLLLVVRDRTREIRYQEMRKEFVANVSHELRTPLTLIKGFVETLQDGVLHDPVKGPQYLAVVEKHVNQLTNLVNDLLELSKLEARPELPKPSLVNVGECVNRVTELMRPAAEKKSQTLALQVASGLPPVHGNVDYLERAISNLLDNAIKYTPERGRIEIAAGMPERTLTVTVSDSGIGIPLEDQARIFERFYRVDKSRSREMGGTGLGLAIVKHVALAHGGRVELDSTPGKGSTFRLILPSGAANPAHEPQR